MSSDQSNERGQGVEHLSIEEDDDGNIWFGTIYSGAWRWDGESLKHFGAEDGLTSENIHVIYTDKRGELWFGVARSVVEGATCVWPPKACSST